MPDDVVELLQRMIGFDTVTPRDSGRLDAEHPLAEWLGDLATEWGMATEWLPVAGFSPNLLVTCQTDPAAPWWLFDSHLDTVGVEGMTIDPFAAELREGRVWGRGACDTKGTGAAMLWALLETSRAGKLGANVALLFTVCEEDHQQGAIAFIEHSLAKLSWQPAGIVVGEPTEMRVIDEANGFVRWKVHTLGVAAHSSTPQLGRNAIVDMAHVIQRLQAEHIAPIENSGTGSCSINIIEGGTQSNIVAERCVISIDERMAPGCDPEQTIRHVQQLLSQLASEREGMRWEITQIEIAPPMALPAEGKFAQGVAEILQRAGLDSATQSAPYTTNGNHYAAAGLPCVVLGPGDIAQAHTKEESIGVAELQQGISGYAALMQSSPIDQ